MQNPRQIQSSLIIRTPLNVGFSGAFVPSRIQLILASTLEKIGLLCAGALLTFPARIPGTSTHVRTVDLLSAAAVLCLFFFLLKHIELQRSIRTLALAAGLSINWIIVDILNYDSQLGSGRARMILFRWLMSLPIAYWITVLMSVKQHRRSLILGMTLGCVLSLVSVAYENATFDPSKELNDSEDGLPVWIYDEYRASGIFSHPNAATAVVLLAVPLVVGAIEENLLSPMAIVIPIGLLGSMFFLTMTRGSSLVASIIIAFHLLIRFSRRQVGVFLLFSGTICSAAFLALQTGSFGTVPLVERLLDKENVSTGAGERFATTAKSFDIALTHPFGVGSRYEQMLYQATGFTATHNGYLQLAMMAGIPLAFFVTIGLVKKAANLRNSSQRIEGWTATYLLGIFCFENQFFVATFSVLTLWLLCRTTNQCQSRSHAH